MASLWERVRRLERALEIVKEFKNQFIFGFCGAKYRECGKCGGLFNTAYLYSISLNWFCTHCRPEYDRVILGDTTPRYFKTMEVEVDVNGNPINTGN